MLNLSPHHKKNALTDNPTRKMPRLAREEYIEQAYFFEAFRERLEDGFPAQEILARIGEELLSTTNLPRAVYFLQAECKLSGLIAPAMRVMAHYFSPFQTFVIAKAEAETGRFDFSQALLILQREARYRAEGATPAGMFVYQFEAVSRNRLGYREGLAAMSRDDLYSEDWQNYISTLLARLGDVDFADLIIPRNSRFSSAKKKVKSPAPTAAATRFFSSRPCSASLATPKCHAHAARTRPRPRLCSLNSACCNWKTA